jgi:hypothetical protein
VSGDTIDVVPVSTTDVEYRWNPKDTNFGQFVRFTISDVSTTYGRPTGTIWRWEHDGGSTNFDDVVEGDLLSAIDMPTTWDNGNTYKTSGDGRIGGFPIIAANATSRYVDVVNPEGVAMADTAVGTGTVVVTPTPVLEWKLSHYAKTEIVQIVLAAGTATATTATEHKLNVGDTFTIDDNGLAQTTTVATIIDQTNFTFTDTTASADGSYDNGNLDKSGKTVTRYRVEPLGFNDLFRLKAVAGDLPKFVDNGVAVDDFIQISGSTFNSLNSGTFRVLAVDDDSVVY